MKVKNNKLKKVSGLTPKQITEELNRFIIGQDDAKKAVAIALRNRYRRKEVSSPLKEEIVPKNILCIGPTGVGKTEIARRLAKLANAPFVKVEATKFTEVGYVGRDVESIIRDLLDVAIKDNKARMKKEVQKKAEIIAKEKIIDALVGDKATEETRNKFGELFDKGAIDSKEIEVEISDNPSPTSSGFDLGGAHVGMVNIGEMIGKAMGSSKTKKVKLSVEDAFKAIIEDESTNMVDEDKAAKEAIKSVENDGIVFIDEIDKICARESTRGGEVSREGVQRDLLPLVEGTTVSTKYGLIKTDHILFIASGAFHTSKPSDLLPELQGRFPTRVKLKPLTEGDLLRILTEPESSLIKQYEALLAVENVILDFTKSGSQEIAAIAFKVNNEVENIGARRLHTMMEKILEEISFEACDIKKDKVIKIDAEYVQKNLGDMAKGFQDLSKFIL